MMNHHHRRPSLPFVAMGSCDGSGPICKSRANEAIDCRSMNTNIVVLHPHDVAPPPPPPAKGVIVAARTSSSSLQPFNISTTTTTTTTTNNTITTFKSPGAGVMAAAAAAAAFGGCYPFTSAQWKELETQAMIYKYMVASIPVPPHLLLHLISSDPSATHLLLGSTGGSSIFNLRFCNSGNKDPEPGRCKRTDGKKWRCSRDVAPLQKYCERHMHRSRPRSRKHVEVVVNQDANLPPPLNSNKSKKTRLDPKSVPLPRPTVQVRPNQNQTPMALNPKSVGYSSAPSYKEPDRGTDWMMGGEMVTGVDESEQQWQHLMQTNMALATEGSIYNSGSSVFRSDYGEQEALNLIPYNTDFGAFKDIQQNEECNLFLNQDFVSIEKQECTRGFIEAWSNDNPPNTTTENNNAEPWSSGNLSPSSLNLSMAMAVGDVLDEEMGQIPTGLGVVDEEQRHNTQPQEVPSWSSDPVSWVGSAPGGPLAEVLLPKNVAVGSNPASPSPPATTVSSPSGVLQRATLHSDSSVCNSPTIAATPEIVAFQWLS